MTLAKAQGTLAADTFKSKVEATVKKAIMADKRVSIPLPAAYFLFIVFFFLIAFLGLVIAANIFLFHSMELWKLIGFPYVEWLLCVLQFCMPNTGSGYRK